jgi:predicted ATPase
MSAGATADAGPDTAGMIRTPDQRVRVFVSSTLDELTPERDAVRHAIEQLHLTPVMFELGARPHPPRELYRAYLAQSHIFVGIYWQRYGWVAPGESVSGLEDEYVLSARIPRLLYLKSPAPDRERRLSELIERMQSEDSASYRHFETPDELTRLVQDDLAILLSERFEATNARPATAPATEQPSRSVSPPPLPPTPTLGRDRDIEAVAELLRGGTRLLTLSGAGGIGKSRLALEVAQRLADEFGPDLYYVSVESVTSPELLLRTIADSLQVRLEGIRGPLDALVGYLRERRSLLLLDNFEQVVDAAAQVAALLDQCPRLQVLVTSRQVLRLRAEREFPVSPLDVPAENIDAEQVMSRVPSAVQLFVQRAQAAHPGFALTLANAAVVAELCRRLDGLPLAIELAAARIRLLSPEAMLDRIERRLDLPASAGPDLPARQRTLRATLDWSHQLLTPSEQALFARLSVFAGGATLEAIEAVCGGDDGMELLDGLSSLLEKSLLTSSAAEAVGPPRLRMLQTVRDYARERLAERDEMARFGDRHLDWFLRASEPADVLQHPDAYAYWPVIEADTDNFRAAVRWALERRALHPLAMLSWNLWPWYWQSGRLLEALGWLDEAVALVGPDADPKDAARLWLWTGVARFQTGDLAGAEPLVTRATSTFRELGDETAMAAAQIMRAGVLIGSGRAHEVDDELEWALKVMRAHGIDWGVGYAAFTQGSLAELRGDVAGARTAEQEALAAAGRIGLEPLQVLAQIQLAFLDLAQGHLDQTRRRLAVAATTLERIRYLEGTGYALDAAAGLAIAEGRPEAAAAALRATDEIRERLGMPIWPLLHPLRDTLVAASSGHQPPSLGGDSWFVLRQTLSNV